MESQTDNKLSVLSYFQAMVLIAVYVSILMIIIDMVRFNWQNGGFDILAGKGIAEIIMVGFALMIVVRFRIKDNNYLAMISVLIAGVGFYMYYEYVKSIGEVNIIRVCLNYLDYCAGLVLFNVVFIISDCFRKYDRS